MTFSKEMQRALEADGEKLRQLTGEEHGPVFPTPADVLAEGSPYWRSLLTGRPLSGVCDRCRKPGQLKECCGSWSLIQWLCEECRKPTHTTGKGTP